jgi:hypothetical protein
MFDILSQKQAEKDAFEFKENLMRIKLQNKDELDKINFEINKTICKFCEIEGTTPEGQITGMPDEFGTIYVCGKHRKKPATLKIDEPKIKEEQISNVPNDIEVKKLQALNFIAHHLGDISTEILQIKIGLSIGLAEIANRQEKFFEFIRKDVTKNPQNWDILNQNLQKSCKNEGKKAQKKNFPIQEQRVKRESVIGSQETRNEKVVSSVSKTKESMRESPNSGYSGIKEETANPPEDKPSPLLEVASEREAKSSTNLDGETWSDLDSELDEPLDEELTFEPNNIDVKTVADKINENLKRQESMQEKISGEQQVPEGIFKEELMKLEERIKKREEMKANMTKHKPMSQIERRMIE